MRIFAATSRYVQGAGALDHLGQHCRPLGSRAFVVTDVDMARLLGERVVASFDAAGLACALEVFPGEITHAAINALARTASAFGAEMVVGLGGGKALDTAKGVALQLGARSVSVPTIASNDGPASAAIAVYDEQHIMQDILQLPRNPELVLVDTQVIANAPVRFLRAGIGDAISKKFEAEACATAGAHTLLGTPASLTGLMAAEACYRIIREHAPAALRAAGRRQADSSLEALVEATVLLSTLSFENGGLSLAHALARGFSYLERAKGTLHGDHVAYGLLVQLVMEKREPAFIGELCTFYREVGLFTRLADFGLVAPSREEVRDLAEKSMVSPSAARFAPPVDADQLEAAIHQVEALTDK
ncbi:glycerol dehydrogenase [Pseudomonas nitroreducens]|uniref:Glycerol dehydrogenase n=1 Tax=Pseudomonas nitroreducens TaxID=46680 RepID=A0A6G6J396_PSENT|nr:glycerol dehydrogenase [Pseudomonas nitroreducens]QIE89789.1 glycerol dehydrogenase [Pseudomonas nitroreducens]